MPKPSLLSTRHAGPSLPCAPAGLLFQADEPRKNTVVHTARTNAGNPGTILKD